MTENTYHFIGLGGIGMSALARILMQQGAEVRGSDAAASPLLEQLGKEGAKVKVGHDAAWIQKGTTVVFSSSILENSSEPISRKRSGSGAHTNIVPLGGATGQPARVNPWISTSRRFW